MNEKESYSNKLNQYFSSSSEDTSSTGVNSSLNFIKILKEGNLEQFSSFLDNIISKDGGLDQNYAHEILSKLIGNNQVYKEHQKCAILLISKYDIDPNYEVCCKILEEKGTTLLMKAASKDLFYVVEALLGTKYKNIDKTDKQENTALGNCILYQETSSKYSEKIADILLEAGADPNGIVTFKEKDKIKKEAFLIYCLKKNLFQITKSLLKVKVNINAFDNKGDTALHIAARKGMEEQTKWILTLHPNLSIKNKNNQTAFQIAKGEAKLIIQKQQEGEELEAEMLRQERQAEIERSKDQKISCTIFHNSQNSETQIVPKNKEHIKQEERNNKEQSQPTIKMEQIKEDQLNNSKKENFTKIKEQENKDQIKLNIPAQSTESTQVAEKNTLPALNNDDSVNSKEQIPILTKIVNSSKKGLKKGSSSFNHEQMKKEEPVQKQNQNMEVHSIAQNATVNAPYISQFQQKIQLQNQIPLNNGKIQPIQQLIPGQHPKLNSFSPSPIQQMQIQTALPHIDEMSKSNENSIINSGFSLPLPLLHDYYKYIHSNLKAAQIVQRNPNNVNKITIDVSDESKQNNLRQSAQEEDINLCKQRYEQLIKKSKIKDQQILELENEINFENNYNQQQSDDQTSNGNQSQSSQSTLAGQEISQLFVCHGNQLDWENDNQKRKYQSNQITQFQNSQMLSKEELLPPLNKEIRQFENEVSQYNEKMKKTFDGLIDRVTCILTQKYPSIKLETYGSYPTQLCLPWSDIDIVLTFTDSQIPTASHRSQLQKIENILKNEKDLVSDTNNVANATVPVLKVTCTKEYDSKKLDITIMESKHKGTECVKLVNNYLAHYKLLKPLVLVLKHFLFSLELNDTYRGGLSSYSLILMLVYFLQSKSNDFPQSEADLLIQFLVFYGYEDNKYVSPSIVSSSDKPHQKPANYLYPNYPQESKIYIIDPHNPENNVSRSTYNYNKIQTAMMCGYKIIHSMHLCEFCQKQNRERQQFNKTPCIILKRFFFLPKCLMEYGDFMMLA